MTLIGTSRALAGADVKGWCPGAFRPMKSGDGLLVRLRPTGGRLSQEQALGVAALSRRYGNGLMDLTARANLQIRGVQEENHQALLEALCGLSVLVPPVGREMMQNIVVTPFWRAGDGTLELAAALSDALADVDQAGLPDKFGFAVDIGAEPVLRDISADIRIERLDDEHLLCRADNADFGAVVAPDEAAAKAISLTQWFIESGGRRRMADLLAPASSSTINEMASADPASRLKSNTAPWPSAGPRLPEAFLTQRAKSPKERTEPLPGPTQDGLMVALAFGQLDADVLALLGRTAPIRLTPWRMLLLEGALSAPHGPGLILAADDPLLRVVACTGAPGCAQARAPTRPLARDLAPYVPRGGLLHVSGCSKGCAHPRRASHTLVAQETGFDLVRDGAASARPYQFGLTPERLRAEPEILAMPS